MSGKLTVSLIALVAMGFAAPAMAAGYGPPGSGQYYVDVNIEVTPVVSLWSNDDSIELILDGGAINEDIEASSLSIINNVDANIKASVTGTLPAPLVPGGGINFFLFPNSTVGAAQSAIVANNYGPAGALVWNYGNISSPNEQVLVASTGVNTSVVNVPVIYAATSPGEAVLPNNFGLTVTYTIAENP